jgi:hypothetical protein
VTAYSSDVQKAVSFFNFEPNNTVIANKATYNGTLYQKDLFVVVAETDEGFLFGKILNTVCFNAK